MLDAFLSPEVGPPDPFAFALYMRWERRARYRSGVKMHRGRALQLEEREGLDSYQSIAAWLGISNGKARRLVGRLVDCGVARVTASARGPERGLVYRLHARRLADPKRISNGSQNGSQTDHGRPSVDKGIGEPRISNGSQNEHQTDPERILTNKSVLRGKKKAERDAPTALSPLHVYFGESFPGPYQWTRSDQLALDRLEATHGTELVKAFIDRLRQLGKAKEWWRTQQSVSTLANPERWNEIAIGVRQPQQSGRRLREFPNTPPIPADQRPTADDWRRAAATLDAGPDLSTGIFAETSKPTPAELEAMVRARLVDDDVMPVYMEADERAAYEQGPEAHERFRLRAALSVEMRRHGYDRFTHDDGGEYWA